MSGRMSETKKALGLTRDQLNPGTDEDNAKYGEIVYKRAGSIRGPNGQKCLNKGVSSEGELKQALKSGWSATPGEALNVDPTEEELIEAEIKELESDAKLDEARRKLERLRKEKADRAPKSPEKHSK